MTMTDDADAGAEPLRELDDSSGDCVGGRSRATPRAPDIDKIGAGRRPGGVFPALGLPIERTLQLDR
jgi:hypothetical protein